MLKPDSLLTLVFAGSFFLFLHFLSAEESRARRGLLKIFARWVEVPLLRFVWLSCRGPLSFLTRFGPSRWLLTTFLARPFARYMDTGVPVPPRVSAKLAELLEGEIAVGECRCHAAKKTCDHPPVRDIVIRTGAEAWLWAFPESYRRIGKEEAVNIINQCAELGMFTMVFIHCSTARHVNEYVICNCCECGCKVHLLNRTLGQDGFPLRDGGFRSFHNPEKCEQCGECAAACPFQAISLGPSGIEIRDCFGCGVCERACKRGAFRVKRVHPGPPWAQEAWRMAGEELE